MGRAGVTTNNDGTEQPVYFIRSKAIFRDGESILCIDKNGKIQKENKYTILKDKNGNDKYIIKKDENSYHRYSIDGHLIDSIKKEINGYTYITVNGSGKEKVKTEIVSTENIDKIIELTKGQIKIEKKGLEDEYKIEEQLFSTTGIYPDGNTFVKQNNFFIKHVNFIRSLCEEECIINKDDTEHYYDTNALIVMLSLKLAGKTEKEELKLSDVSKAKSHVLKKLFEKYNYKIFALDAKDKIIEEITTKSVNDIQKKYGKKVKFTFLDKERNDLFLDSYANSMKFFDETNILGVDSKKNIITIGDNIIDNKEKYTYYFVKPVGQPMYFFKKEAGGEFSNHSNFELKEGETTREVEAAGSITIKEGKICNINNSSGHFKPKSESIKTALAYIASKTKNCKIENLIHDSCKNTDGTYPILTDIEDVVKLSKDTGKCFSECMEDKKVVKPLTKADIIAINTKAARMISKGHSIN